MITLEIVTESKLRLLERPTSYHFFQLRFVYGILFIWQWIITVIDATFAVAWVSGVSGEKGKDGSEKGREKFIFFQFCRLLMKNTWSSWPRYRRDNHNFFLEKEDQNRTWTFLTLSVASFPVVCFVPFFLLSRSSCFFPILPVPCFSNLFHSRDQHLCEFGTLKKAFTQ